MNPLLAKTLHLRQRQRSTERQKAMSKKSGTGGGGSNTRQHVRTGVRGGPPATKVISPSAAANQGLSKGNHASEAGGKVLQRPADPLVQGTRPQVASGNTKALDVGRGGPGAGRVVHPSSSQSRTTP
jgi:hypothetical protein